MNNPRRTRLKNASDLLSQSIAIVEQVKEEEEEAFDNLPESLQYADKGERMQEILSQLDDVMAAIEQAMEGIDDAVS